MSKFIPNDTRTKLALKSAYGSFLLFKTILNFKADRNDKRPRIFYGGARTGDLGGPLVKVQRLRHYFPEHSWNFNLVYCLSNAPYLNDMSLAILRKRRIPIIHNQNGMFYKAWYDGDWRAQNAWMSRTYHQASHVFWQSEFCRRSAQKFLGDRDGPGEVLYNAVDTNHFKPLDRAPNERIKLLLTGKIDNHLFYRLESTLRGFAYAVMKGLDGEITIAGWIAPIVQKKIYDLANELRIYDRLKFIGAYNQTDAPAIYSSADIYIMTKHNDPCPNTVLEAMACGLPVVHSISGGVPELVGDTAPGVFVPEDFERVHVPSAKELGEAILIAATNRNELSKKARRRAVENFDIAWWIERHRQIFNQFLN